MPRRRNEGIWAIYDGNGGSPGAVIDTSSGLNFNTTCDQNANGWDFYDITFDLGGIGVAVNAGDNYFGACASVPTDTP